MHQTRFKFFCFSEKIIPQKFGYELKNIHLCNIIYTHHTMTTTINYYHADADCEYTVTATILLAVKYQSDPFSRFREPEDDDEVNIDSIIDSEGNEIPESDFDAWTIQDMRDRCYMEACEL